MFVHRSPPFFPRTRCTARKHAGGVEHGTYNPSDVGGAVGLKRSVVDETDASGELAD